MASFKAQRTRGELSDLFSPNSAQMARLLASDLSIRRFAGRTDPALVMEILTRAGRPPFGGKRSATH
jgi:hypothetical protein